MEMLHKAPGVSVRQVEQGADSIALIADAVVALPQTLQAIADRRAAQARQAEQETAARQQKIAAGVFWFRERYADRRRQEAEAVRDDLARVLDGPSTERAFITLLDGVEERQRAALKVEAEQKAALEAKMRPRSSPGMGW